MHGIFASTVEPQVERVVQKIVQTTDYKDYYQKRVKLDFERESTSSPRRHP